VKDEDIQAVALKHKLPVVPKGMDTPWAYTDRVLAFGRDLAGEEWPDNLAFPPMPHPPVVHGKLGDLFARFDMQMYAVQFEKRARTAISEELGLQGSDSGNPELILQAIKDMRIHADHCALDSWWVKSLMELWGNGSQTDNTRRAAKVACNMAAQLHAGPEADRRDAFEAIFPMPHDCMRVGDGYAATSHNAWHANRFIAQWEGFKACALRAEPPKSECAARKQGTAGGNMPADCDWPGCDCDPKTAKVIDALHDAHQLAMTHAQSDVLRERAAHFSREGFTNKGDDAYAPGTLARAGACYAKYWDAVPGSEEPGGWPWLTAWWKPTTPRRNLVKAVSLLLAEIEKIDRQPVIGAKQ
jgi:hypothetical protein